MSRDFHRKFQLILKLAESRAFGLVLITAVMFRRAFGLMIIYDFVFSTVILDSFTVRETFETPKLQLDLHFFPI